MIVGSIVCSATADASVIDFRHGSKGEIIRLWSIEIEVEISDSKRDKLRVLFC